MFSNIDCASKEGVSIGMFLRLSINSYAFSVV